MKHSKFDWIVRRPVQLMDDEVKEAFKLSQLEIDILENRNYVTKEDVGAILSPKFHDAKLLSNIEEVSNKIFSYLNDQEKVLIYGDFDADGITSTAMLYKRFSNMNPNVDYFIPNRLEEGYGATFDGFTKAQIETYSLVIFVDNGISSVEEIQWLKKRDIDVIVIDHHQFRETLPDALILHPNLEGSQYPYKELCAAGVSYKLLEYMNLSSDEDLILAGIATVADLVPMINENKKIVTEALKRMNHSNISPLVHLLRASGHSGVIDEETIAFTIAPRLNATGRLGQALFGVRFLNETDNTVLMDQSLEIERMNNERKALVEETFLHALDQVDEMDSVHVVYNDDWHSGVLGIVASKIVEQFGKPAIVLTLKEDTYHGSARSVEGIDLHKIISTIDSVKFFGGHAQALGLQIDIDNIVKFKTGIIDYVNALDITLKPERQIDIQMTEKNISLKEYERFLRLKPFGHSFTAPIVLLHDATVGEVRKVGRDKNHIKMTFPKYRLDTIGFGLGHLGDEVQPDDSIHLIGTLNINEFNQKRSLQMMVEDVRIDHVQIIDMRSKIHQNFNSIKKDDIFLINDDKEKPGDNYYYYGENLPFSIETLILRDLPNDIELLKTSLNNIYVSKIIVIFHQLEELYFAGIPSASDIEKVDEILKHAKREVDLKKFGYHLAEKANVSMKFLKIIVDVLTELKRVDLKHGILYKKELDNALDVESSEIIRKYRGILESETRLKMITTKELKAYIQELLSSE